MATAYLETPIEYLKGVGPKKGEMLRKELNVDTFEDLLTHYPFRYVDRSRFYCINEIMEDMPYIQLKGKVTSMDIAGALKSKRLTALFTDGTGMIELVWFQGIRWIQQSLKTGVEYIVFGKPGFFKNKIYISHPEMDVVSEENLKTSSAMQAVYSSTEKLNARWLNSRAIGKLQHTLLTQLNGKISETLPEDIIHTLKLMTRSEAIRHIHFPEDAEKLSRAQRRLKFEELFYIQLRLLSMKLVRKKENGLLFNKVGDYLNRFYHEALPFKLTQAQMRVIKEIRKDIGSGKQMNRLLQGDVGSGKTVVALMGMLIALDNGYQASLMSPTEILAIQHYQTIFSLLKNLNISVALLTGSTKAKERKKILPALVSGELKIVIGTHALVEEKVKFKNLGFAVIDEQHKFGVEQRSQMWKKNIIPPHMLVMTATPIPRTLAMTLYGDLDISVLDEMPAGRKPVKTVHRFDSSRLRVFGFMKEQIAQGRQIYVVYPLIKESENFDYKDLMDGYESIIRDFPSPQYHVSIVHGRMKPEDKDFEMSRFVKGQTHIMVATNVIEVGVDVSNATVMVIESAERFGLSQLHQLRGRVGRGASQSYCILMTGVKLTEESKTRMATMVKTNDGFEIAEVDMKIRGPGNIEGTQQSGILELKIADLTKDGSVLTLAREAAQKLLERDPEISMQENIPVKVRYENILKQRKEWGRIS